MPIYFYTALGCLAIIGISVNPVTIYLMQRWLGLGQWRDCCPQCGSERSCYPSQHTGLQTGMISTLIESDCPQCGTSVDPSYVAHFPAR